jgi:hypothetical protein
MSRVMGDSTTMSDIPKSVQIVGVYVDGHFGVVTQTALEIAFPHSKYGHCIIDVNGSRPDADARDWETGDKTGDLEQWVIQHNKHTGKKDAVIYCNRSTIPEVRRLTKSQILNKDYFLWIATLDGTPYTGFGVMGCQRDGERQTGGHWDRSIIYDDRFWKASAPPAPMPMPDPARPNCTAFQEAVRATEDNLWGHQTSNHGLAVAAAGASRFPFGVKYTQQCVGTVDDGDWGPKSRAALVSTVMNCQHALKSMGFDPKGADGSWGVNTEKAFLAAQKACHI